MDGIANVARQQQSQASTVVSQGRAVEQSMQTQPKQDNVVKELQQEIKNHGTEMNSEKDVKDLVNQLNKAIEPLSTDIQFGVDSQDVFYVSVIDQKTDRMIRRFPAEQAQDFLPKMKEVSGILFDTRG